MRDYTLTHLSDAALLRELTMWATRDRETTAMLLAHIAEVDARRAYVPEGCSSMFVYCVERLLLSEDAASKRIQAARAARRLPALFDALAEGRLHLSALWLLAPHITPENADELIEAATHRRKSEIEAFLARRFPAFRPPATATIIKAVGYETRGTRVADAGLFDEHAPGHVDPAHDRNQHAPGHVPSGSADDEHAPGHVDAERYLVRVTIGRSTHDKLRHAQALLSHTVPSGDVAQVLDRALDALIARLERQKLGAARLSASTAGASGVSPRRRKRPGRAGSRHIPTRVRRAVWERDGGQCTFMGPARHRCESRCFLEFDHVEPFARGGMSTVDGLRLRCRAHNQYGAEQMFGAEFMRAKRDRARADREATKAAVNEAREQVQDLIAGLRGLGSRPDDARRAAEHAMTLECGTFEERLRAALAFGSRRGTARSALNGSGFLRERRARYGPRTWDARTRWQGTSRARPVPAAATPRAWERSRAHATLGRCTPSPIRSAT